MDTEHSTELMESYQILKTYYQEGLSRAHDKDSEYWCNLKYVHSQDVLAKGEVILAQESVLQQLSSIDQERLRVSLLLHDIGRFFEDVQNIGVRFDHGEKAVELLLQEQNTFFHHPYILLAIRYHNKKDLQGALADTLYTTLSPEEQTTAWILMQAVRDADKVSNFIKVVHEGFYYSPGHLNNQQVTPEAWEQITQHVMVDSACCHTVLDSILRYVAWLFDINFKTSTKMLSVAGITETFIREWRKYGGNDVQAQTLQVIMSHYLNNDL